MGLLKVTGKLDLSQFWGSGGDSDADTAHVQISKILYDGKATTVFEHALVRGRSGKKEVIRNGGITVRWQGIDAPELHYTPTVAKQSQRVGSHNLRQHYGESSTVALHAFLEGLAAQAGKKTMLDCTVTTEVASPNDVFDTYGRFIGDVIVQDHAKEVNANQWLVEHGWAFPTFYASMTADEITILRDAATTARQKRRGIWEGFTQELSFDYDLRHEPAGDSKPTDSGPVVLPKIFRRLSTEYVMEGQITDFKAYLRGQKAPDRAYLLDEFLEQGPAAALQHDLSEFTTSSTVTFRPSDLVFVEAPSTLYDQRGHKITSWQQK